MLFALVGATSATATLLPLTAMSEFNANVTAGTFTTWNEACSLRVNDAVEEFATANAFVEMVENVSRVIEGREGWIVPSADSIRVAQILDDIARTQPKF